MQVECVKCKKVEELSEDDLNFLLNAAKRYTDEISPNDFTAILSVTKGKCSDNKKHIFIFHEDFSKKIAGLIEEYDKLSSNNIVKEKELSDILKKIEDLKNEIKNLEEKRDVDTKDIDDLNKAIADLMVIFEKETGTRDVKMWS